MDLGLKGKRVLVTGGTKSIGRAIVDAFVAEGAVVGFCARDAKLVKQREDFRGRRIVIAGGGDSAVDWTLLLAELAAKLYVIHRRPKFRAAPESVARIDALAKAGKI